MIRRNLSYFSVGLRFNNFGFCDSFFKKKYCLHLSLSLYIYIYIYIYIYWERGRKKECAILVKV